MKSLALLAAILFVSTLISAPRLWASENAEISNEVFIEDSLCEMKPYENSQNKKASLIFQMTAKKHTSGVVYAVNFELSNNTNRNISIMVKPKITDSILIVILLNKDKGVYITDPRIRMYKDEQDFNKILIKSGGKNEWLINLKDILKTDSLVKRELTNDTEALLIVYFYFDYILAADGCEKRYKEGEFSLMQERHFSLESYLTPEP